MSETVTKLPVKTESKAPAVRHPFEALHQEIDRLFDDFGGFWGAPFRRLEPIVASPAVDIAERDNDYEVTAELPGLDEKDIEVKLSNGGLMISGEKKQETEQKKKGYHLSERRYGSFQRYFSLPEGIDTGKIAATFKKGVLTVTLPKTAEAKKQEQKIAIKAA
jgi:HSP20 family protein